MILLTDQQRADAIGAAGAPDLRTPAIDRLAREGVRFTRAFCATPQCSPSRAALLTGRYPHRTGVVGNVEPRNSAATSPPLDSLIPSLGRVFASAGYETAYFGKWHLGNDPGAHGFAFHQAGDGRALADPVVRFLKVRRERRQAERPLLLVASWLKPHDIYRIHNEKRTAAAGAARRVRLPRSLRDDLADKPFPQRHFLEEDQGKPFLNYSRQDWERYLAFYDELTEQVDFEIGQVVQQARSGNPETLIVFSSDHGDLGGAHGLPFKGPAMYEELVRIPLIFSWPGKLKPSVNRALAGNVDLLPTLCQLADIPPPRGIDGRSLSDFLQGKQPVAWRDAIFVEYHGKQNWRVPIRMVRTDLWKYVRYLGYGEELYDLGADPDEMHNLAASPKHQAIKTRLAARLDRWMAETGDPFPSLTVTDRAGRVKN